MVKLKRQAEIAVNILTLCADPAPGRPVTTRDAARLVGTTKDFAAQVVAKLVREGYLEAARGRTGGIKLAVPAHRISVGEILRLLEPDFANVASGEAASAPAFGAFGVVVQAAARSFAATFDDFSIADLTGDPASGRVACLDCGLFGIFRPARGKRLHTGSDVPLSSAAARPAPLGVVG